MLLCGDADVDAADGVGDGGGLEVDKNGFLFAPFPLPGDGGGMSPPPIVFLGTRPPTIVFVVAELGTVLSFSFSFFLKVSSRTCTFFFLSVPNKSLATVRSTNSKSSSLNPSFSSSIVPLTAFGFDTALGCVRTVFAEALVGAPLLVRVDGARRADGTLILGVLEPGNRRREADGVKMEVIASACEGDQASWREKKSARNLEDLVVWFSCGREFGIDCPQIFGAVYVFSGTCISNDHDFFLRFVLAGRAFAGIHLKWLKYQ
ncbi:hypothetical protein BT69DRAFT_83741 [Atractiella rhizophila]|nr:hypothetical protein BT69DRAFT_83741 [Atractiella rhizophila]